MKCEIRDYMYTIKKFPRPVKHSTVLHFVLGIRDLQNKPVTKDTCKYDARRHLVVGKKVVDVRDLHDP